MTLIPINLQPGEVFDRLSVLFVKLFQTTDISTKSELNQQIQYLQEQINNKIGYDLAKTIFESKEYNSLYEINKELFNFVGLAKKDEIRASDVDFLNHQRYLAKKELQSKFFGEKLVEIKIGY